MPHSMSGSYRLNTGYRLLLAMLTFGAALAVVCLALTGRADAEAVPGPPTNFSSAPSLPDGRVYEQVSPTDKNGNEAGTGTNLSLGFALARYALAAPNGNGVFFEGTGPMGETAAGYNLYFVAQWTPSGWKTKSFLPRQQKPTTSGTIDVQPNRVDPSTDLSHVMFKSSEGLFAQPPNPTCGEEEQLYLNGLEPGDANAKWLDRPSPLLEDPVENCGGDFGAASGAAVGGTPDFSTAYFAYPGTLLPEDSERAPHTHGEERGEESVEAWGLYEYSNGVLKEAGVLPDGSLNQFGAVPAASQHGRALSGNQVSADGTRLFFVSPDPESCERANNCAVNPPELYVRENEKSALISQDTLAPAVDGLPAGAPDGVSEMPNPTHGFSATGELTGADVFASPDGSQAFFQSEDKLTAETPEGPPANKSPKTYDFDVNTGTLTYLPNVTGQILATSQTGSSFAFVDSSVPPAELDLWSDGPAGGVVTAITQLPGGQPVSVARMSSDGSVVVFQTDALIAGFNNGGNHFTAPSAVPEPGSEQIYRYDAPSDTLSCVSCPPVGFRPISNAELSPEHTAEVEHLGLASEAGQVEEHGVSADGSRVFFDTADPLVPQDSNTGFREESFEGGANYKQVGRDVYEWENGTVYLISSGKSLQNSYFLDSSESGSDVFFATAEGLVPGDTDGAYDVYDARIPHPGDSRPPAAVPCEGSVCQGPPNVPSPLTPPASATFSGPGNPAPETAPPPTKAITPKPTKCKKDYVKKKNKCVKKPNAKSPTHKGKS